MTRTLRPVERPNGTAGAIRTVRQGARSAALVPEHLVG
jgi:hypothetical protein